MTQKTASRVKKPRSLIPGQNIDYFIAEKAAESFSDILRRRLGLNFLNISFSVKRTANLSDFPVRERAGTREFDRRFSRSLASIQRRASSEGRISQEYMRPSRSPASTSGALRSTRKTAYEAASLPARRATRPEDYTIRPVDAGLCGREAFEKAHGRKISRGKESRGDLRKAALQILKGQFLSRGFPERSASEAAFSKPPASATAASRGCQAGEKKLPPLGDRAGFVDRPIAANFARGSPGSAVRRVYPLKVFGLSRAPNRAFKHEGNQIGSHDFRGVSATRRSCCAHSLTQRPGPVLPARPAR